jgi:hypothetical protein
MLDHNTQPHQSAIFCWSQYRPHQAATTSTQPQQAPTHQKDHIKQTTGAPVIPHARSSLLALVVSLLALVVSLLALVASLLALPVSLLVELYRCSSARVAAW